MNEENKVVRLAKPVKKGLLRLVFSRFFVIALLLVLQIAILVLAYGYFTDKLPILINILRLFSFVMVIYLFNCPMDSSAKLTWLFFIAIFPLAGAAFLLFTQSNIGHRMERELVARQIENSREFLTAGKGAGIGGARRLGHRRSVPLSEPERLLPAVRAHQRDLFPLLARISLRPCWRSWKRPKSSSSWNTSSLKRATCGAGSWTFWSARRRKAWRSASCTTACAKCPRCRWITGKLLNAQGIKAKPFSAIKPVISSHYNYRDHRKILVIDGKVAFNGGVNLADEYINRKERFGHWKDTAVMLKGAAVKSFTLMFLQMWNMGKRKPDYPGSGPGSDRGVPKAPTGYVMPYCDCPLDADKVGEAVYMDILNRATDYVHIMTPYLILDGELETALKFAAQRGVDVKLILPGIPDKKLAYALAKTHYKSLTEAGVKIYEYTPGFVHAKVFVSDDCKAVVGTINLDYRSLYHHFECATYMYKTDCIPEIEKDFQETLSKCRPVTAETIKNEKLSVKAVGKLAKLIPPLM